jgi:ABC-2 type transport system permease protein/lipopolysaccharide transport system permease protein
MTAGGLSLLHNQALLTKVYAPREVFPLAAMAVAGIDLVVSLIALGALFLITGEAPRWTSIWVAPLFVIQLAFTAGCTILVSAVVVRLRDVRHVLPIVLQLGLFATPVAYGFDDLVKGGMVWLYAALNPLAPVIDGYRRSVLWGEQPQWGPVGVAALVSGLMLICGYRLFKRLEIGFADAA